MGCFSPSRLSLKKKSKIDPSAGPHEGRGGATTLYPWSTNSLKAICNLAPPDSLTSWRHGVATGGQDPKIGKIGHLGWPARVDFLGDLVKPSLVPQALLSPLVPCIGVWLALTLAACCSPRGWSRDGAENSKKSEIWQHGTHCKLHNSG